MSQIIVTDEAIVIEAEKIIIKDTSAFTEVKV